MRQKQHDANAAAPHTSEITQITMPVKRFSTIAQYFVINWQLFHTHFYLN